MPSRALEKILYVEDEDDIRTVGNVALESVGGFTVEACACGQDAVDKAAAFGPDLVLLDVMMPGMDGPSTFENLRKIPETANVPVVFLTAKTQAQDINRLRELGAVDVLTKPFDPMTLADQVRAIWEKQDD